MTRKVLLVLNFFLILLPWQAQAALQKPLPIKNEAYHAKFVSQSLADPIVLAAGEKKTITVKITNTGAKPWKATGANFVSVYTVDPSYRASKFFTSAWLNKSQAAVLKKDAAPASTGEFAITLQAPSTPGTFEEEFHLAAENTTWIPGGYFYFKISVLPKKQVNMEVGELDHPLTPSLKGGEALVTPSPFKGRAGWGLDDSEQLLATSTDSNDLKIPTSTEEFLPLRELITEPSIRVNLFEVTTTLQFVSDYYYHVYFGNEHVASIPPQELAELEYSEGEYRLNTSSGILTSSQFIRLAPDNPEHFFTLPNRQRRLTGRKNNFNAYRGALELRVSKQKDKQVLHAINELPLELYVQGITETSNEAHSEYAKALQTAARTYAFIKLPKAGVKSTGLFDVQATTVDQLYLGYNSELNMPRVVAATKETRGQMVTYGRQPVVTPYFGHSNGRTKSWTKAWGGTDKPWLKSVIAVHDKGKAMWGHGVGMSTADASAHAAKDGWTYQQILKHYYTGTELEKIY